MTLTVSRVSRVENRGSLAKCRGLKFNFGQRVIQVTEFQLLATKSDLNKC